MFSIIKHRSSPRYQDFGSLCELARSHGNYCISPKDIIPRLRQSASNSNEKVLSEKQSSLSKRGIVLVVMRPEITYLDYRYRLEKATNIILLLKPNRGKLSSKVIAYNRAGTSNTERSERIPLDETSSQ